MKEIWKDVKGYGGLYKISTFGNIITKRIWTGKMYIEKERKLKPTIARNGYLRITLTKDGKAKYINIHRLVAETFLSNPNNYPCVNHIDGNKLNNNLENLEWCSYSHNSKEAFRLGLHKTKKGKNSPRSKKVLQYNLKGEFIKEWEYMTKITEELGYDYTNISKCCKGIYKKSKGYIWKYKEE